MDYINLIIWGFQMYLAYFFFQPAIMKLKAPSEKLAQMGLISTNGNPLPIRILAVLELLGVFGIIIPWVFGFCKILTPLAAVGFSLVMLGAIVFNLKKKSYKSIPKLAVAFILAIVVVWFRFMGLCCN